MKTKKRSNLLRLKANQIVSSELVKIKGGKVPESSFCEDGACVACTSCVCCVQGSSF